MDKYLIDGHKLFWHLDRVRLWQEKRLIPAIYLEVSPVSFCNHQCIFCGLDFAMQKKNQLQTAIFCQRLKELGALGVRSMMFAGEGEPLLHKDLPRFVRTAKQSGMDIAITTNGAIADNRSWKEMLPFLSWIRFSLDAGTEDTYAQVHRVAKSCFQQTINNIKQVLRIKKEGKLNVTISLQFLMIEENLKDIEQAIRLALRIGVDYISLKPYSLHPQMLNKRDMVYSQKTITYVQDIVDKYRKNSKTDVVFRKEAMEKYMRKNKQFRHCRALPFWGYISSDGDFYSCSVFIDDERFRIGNIYAQDIPGIFFGKLRKQSIEYAEKMLNIDNECRLNCRMAKINEFLEFIENRPEHLNFV